MASTMKFEVVTPERVVLKEEVEFVLAPGNEGLLGILPHHAALLSGLNIGVVKYRQNGEDSLMAISGGFIEVVDNKVVILADAAEKGEEIDVQRALAAKERAEQRLRDKTEGIDVLRAEMALKRALTRLTAAGKL